MPPLAAFFAALSERFSLSDLPCFIPVFFCGDFSAMVASGAR